ncbi:MAG: radical SAM protein [Deltaproteobacteria bacterium]|jgi:organic radical activating enzyme|nr:radical SAM protein [Deltaproteobacteria bacterium]
MLNLFITPKCDLGCDYCFVAPDFGGAKKDLARAEFDLLLAWLEETGAYSLGLLGGEPTLHPDLFYFLERLGAKGIAPVVFTNGLFPHDFCEPLAGLTKGLVVNYNDPSALKPEGYALREKNLDCLANLGAKLTLAKNFAPGRMDYDYLLKAAARYGVKTIRCDLARPRADGRNNHFIGESLKAAAKVLAAFVIKSFLAGIEAGVDCCLPACFFSPRELSFLEVEPRPLRGVCLPSLDILPDLSVIHCWPLKDIQAPKATVFDGETDLLGHFAQEVVSLRAQRRATCQEPCRPAFSCQGGCLSPSWSTF